MTVRCSHESVYLQCPAGSWKRSCKLCDVNRHRHSAGFLGLLPHIAKNAPPCDGQIPENNMFYFIPIVHIHLFTSNGNSLPFPDLK